MLKSEFHSSPACLREMFADHPGLFKTKINLRSNLYGDAFCAQHHMGTLLVNTQKRPIRVVSGGERLCLTNYLPNQRAFRHTAIQRCVQQQANTNIRGSDAH
ncbi:MAG: hypothetical protein ACR2O2_09180 [Ruegeria sp.]